MHALVDTSVKTLEIVGSLSGVPYVGASAILLRELVHTCAQVAVHKKKCRALADKCAQLLLALNESTSRLQGTELLSAVDSVSAVLERILNRVRRWAEYSLVKQFVRSADIEEGLQQFDKEVDTSFQMFQTTSVTLTYQLQRESLDTFRSDSVEMRDLLYKILTSQQQLQRIAEMQGAGEHVAEPIMQAGQLELRQMREGQRHVLDDDDTRALTSSPPPFVKEDYQEIQQGLLKLHQTTGIPPSIKRLDGEITREGDFAVAGGTYSDIWLGRWLGEKSVALKALRNIRASDPHAQRRFEHGVQVWARLENEHVLPFLGIVTNIGLHIHMVSPWLSNGNVLDYSARNPDANKIHLLSGAAEGLEYLHQHNVIHGNVKCTNILVSEAGEACISDFGMSKIIEEVTDKAASVTLTVSGSARWLSPELIEGINSSPTKASDTYSFAMAILELVTMKPPFSNRKRDASVIHDIMVRKMTPPFPDRIEARNWITGQLWALMQECWRSAPARRPHMGVVAERMKAIDRDFVRPVPEEQFVAQTTVAV